MAEKKRQSNMELLRMLAMFMVVCLHYLSHAGALSVAGEVSSRTEILGDLLESFCIVSVNVYVLITGWFLSKSEFRFGKLVNLIAEILFYTILIPLALSLCGLTPAASNIWERWFYIFPVSMEAYWFITAYVILYILAPFLNAGLDALPQQKLKQLLYVLLFFFCLLPSISPVKLTIDKAGYDCLWFIVLYLIAGYLRRYAWQGISGRNGDRNGSGDSERAVRDGHSGREEQTVRISRGKALCIYLISVLLIFAMTVVLNKVSAGGALLYYAEVPFHYNFIFVLTASLGLFALFLEVKIPEGRIADLIRKVSPLTLGIYLIHENMDIRDLWLPSLEKLFGPVPEGVGLIIHMICCAVLLYLICIAVDAVRNGIFKWINRRTDKFLQKNKGT